MSEVINMHIAETIQTGGGSGAIWLPDVSEEGVISWIRSTSTIAPTARNIKGADGADGQPGAPGQDGQDGADGLGIKSVDINGSNHLIITYDDDTTHDAGEIKGGSVTAAWGSITGTLSDQTDLQTVLNSKASMNDVISYVTNAVLGGAD